MFQKSFANDSFGLYVRVLEVVTIVVMSDHALKCADIRGMVTHLLNIADHSERAGNDYSQRHFERSHNLLLSLRCKCVSRKKAHGHRSTTILYSFLDQCSTSKIDDQVTNNHYRLCYTFNLFFFS